jgi:hypothetical protein
MEIINETEGQMTSPKKWWSDRRTKYNIGLVIAGIVAFICYVIVGVNFIMPYDQHFEITLFEIVAQGIGYLIMMLIANLFYNLGYWADKNYNKTNSEQFRKRVYNIGFWFSFGLPFLIPISLLIQYFIEFHK